MQGAAQTATTLLHARCNSDNNVATGKPHEPARLYHAIYYKSTG